jgi:hypothetical protein
MKRAGLVIWLLTLLAGCVHSTSIQTALPPEAGSPHLLYLQPEPHRRLYVEIDAVQGGEPSEAELIKLKTFLGEWCKKPDGITLVRSSVITRSAARGQSAVFLARQYMNGPPVLANAAQPAYLYVLFYDNRVNRNPLQSPRATSQWPARDTVPLGLDRPENPHVFYFPYPAMIYVDRSWMGGLLPYKYQCESATHEAGHVLGLVRRNSRIKGHHCSAQRCVMGSVSQNVKGDIRAWLKREKPTPDFCDGCTAELRQSQASSDRTTLRFIGPVTVRAMPFYQVLALPGACRLYLGESIEAEAPNFIAEWRRQEDSASGRENSWLSFKGETGQDLESLLPAIEAAKQDPEGAVRWLALQLEGAVRAKIKAPPGREGELWR